MSGFFLLSLLAVCTYLGAFYFIFLKVLKSTNVLNYSTKSCTTQNMSNLVSCQVKVSTASKVIKVISSYSPQQNYLLLNHLELPIPLKIWKKKLKKKFISTLLPICSDWSSQKYTQYWIYGSAYERNRNNWNYSF